MYTKHPHKVKQVNLLLENEYLLTQPMATLSCPIGTLC